MSQHKHHYSKNNLRNNSSETGKNIFWKSLSFRIIFSLIIFVGAFLILYQLNQSEGALVGEAQQAIISGTSEPYYRLYEYYSNYKQLSGEKPNFGEFNNAVYRSNVFYLDSSKNFFEERNNLINNPKEIRLLTNKVYAKVDSKTLKQVAGWIIAEDSLKSYMFNLEYNTLLEKNLPISDAAFLAVSGEEPSVTSSALSKSAFVDCVKRNTEENYENFEQEFILQDFNKDANSLFMIISCLQTGRTESTQVWNPIE